MFTQIGDEKIVIDFNKGITVRVGGPEQLYYVELHEFKKGDQQPYIVEGIHFTTMNDWYMKEFHLPIEFYMDFEIIIYKFDDTFGLKRIYSHRYNDRDQLVRFILDTDNLDEASVWLKRCMTYKKRNECHVEIISNFDEINSYSETRFKDRNLTPYKTYRIGKFPKNSNDWKTVDPRKEGVIWFGNWKTFWSYQHPRLWKSLSSQEIVDDILGL
jgi:hypothetical protein